MTEATSPAADRAFPDTQADLPDWLARVLARIIVFVQALGCGAHFRRHSLGAPAWCHDRPNLPPGSAQAETAAIRGPFGRSIEWLCRRCRIDPRLQGWPELSRAIVAGEGSLCGFHPHTRQDKAVGQTQGTPLPLWEGLGEGSKRKDLLVSTPPPNPLPQGEGEYNTPPPPPVLTVAPAVTEPAVAPPPTRPVLVCAATVSPTGSPLAPQQQFYSCTATEQYRGLSRRPDSCRRYAAAASRHTRGNPAVSRRTTIRQLTVTGSRSTDAIAAAARHVSLPVPLRIMPGLVA